MQVILHVEKVALKSGGGSRAELQKVKPNSETAAEKDSSIVGNHDGNAVEFGAHESVSSTPRAEGEGTDRPGKDGTGGRTGLDGGNGVSAAPGSTGKPATGTGLIPKSDFTITADLGIGDGGTKTKFRNNLAAIRVLKELEAQDRNDRNATPDAQKALARYVGWGETSPSELSSA